MRFLKMLLLNAQHVFEQRARAMVWFFVSAATALPTMLFWWGATGHAPSNLTTYYLLLLIANALLSSHIEEDVYDFDIRQGDMVRYLTKPFSYYWLKLFEELPYRLLQGGYGLIVFVIFLIFFKGIVVMHIIPQFIIFGIISCLFAYFLSFTYKMNMGLLGFWFQDMRGIMQLMDITTIIFAGFIVPLSFFPPLLREISYFLPFASMIYFPIAIFQGSSIFSEVVRFLSTQIIWLVIFFLLNRTIWYFGIKEFTGASQ